jgi:hypothetical protein
MVNDMVKISTFSMNAFCHKREEYIGESTESFWCQVMSINEDDSTMLVMVSNNCFNSSHEQDSPICFGQYLTIDESYIKEHKKGLINATEQDFNATMVKAIETLGRMDVDQEKISRIQDMNNEEILEFLDEFEKSNTTQTNPQNTRQTTQQKKKKKKKNTKKKTTKN